MRFAALLAALAPLALAGCGSLPIYVGDRQVYDPEARAAEAAARAAAAEAAAAQAAATGAPAPAPVDEGLSLFGLPVYVGDQRVGAGGGNAGLPAFNVPVYIGDTQVAGPRPGA